MTRTSRGSHYITMLFPIILAVLFQGVQSDEKRLLIDDSQSVSEQLRILNDELLALKSTVSTLQQTGQGSTYVHWGRTTCPNEAELMYKGYVGGSHYTHTGGAANWLCLPSNPEWGYYEENVASGAKVYGGEYEFSDFHSDGGSKFFGKNLNDEDAPCAVCRVERSSTVMVPARLTCPDDSWSMEYTGYLVAGDFQHGSATEYICLDNDAEMIVGGAANEDGRVFYLAEAICGSLTCPPYVDGRELTCVVCSK